MIAFEGVITNLAMPFHDNETHDLDSWRCLLEFMVSVGIDGVTTSGVLGESNRLNDHEREELIRAAVSMVRQRVPIIVETSDTGTPAAICLSKMAEDLGADAVMVTPAKETMPNDDLIVEPYRRLTEQLSISIVLQDHPASTEVHLSLVTVGVTVAPGCRTRADASRPRRRRISFRTATPGRSKPSSSGLCQGSISHAPLRLDADGAPVRTGHRVRRETGHVWEHTIRLLAVTVSD